MLKRLLWKLLVVTTLVALALVPLRIALNQIGGLVLKRVFAAGTDCVVTLKRPRVYFAPLSAAVSDVVIRHPSESPDAGFRAKKVSIRLSLPELLKKEVMLTDLRLDGARVDSRGEDTGFLNTLAFLFPEKKEEVTPAPKGRLAQLFSTWSFHITDITIETDPDQQRQFVLEAGAAGVSFDVVQLSFVEPTKDPTEPFDLTGFGSGFLVRPSQETEFSFGDVNLLATIGRGKFKIHDGLVQKGGESGDGGSTEIRGEMSLNSPWSVQADIESRSRGSYLKQFEQVLHGVTPPPEGAELTGKLSGSILEPKYRGQVKILSGDSGFLAWRKECSFRELGTTMEIDSLGLSLSELHADDVLQNGSLKIAWVGSQNFEATGGLNITPEQTFFRRCFGLTESNATPVGASALQALGEALSSSTAEVEMKGTLSPLTIQGKALSELQMRKFSRRSQLEIEFASTEVEAQVKLKERGRIPQIEPSSIRATAPDQATVSQTKFQATTTSSIDIDGAYNFQDRRLRFDKFSLSHYPVEQLLARLVPVFSEQTFQRIAGILRPESMLTAEATLDLDLARQLYRGKGQVEVSELRFGTTGIRSIRIPVNLDNQIISAKNISLQSSTGTLTGNVTVDLNGPLSGSFEAAKLSLPDLFPQMNKVFSELSADFSGKARLSGMWNKPEYQAEATIETFVRGDSSSRRTSRLTLNGNHQGLDLAGDLFQSAASISLHYPLGKSPREQVKLNAVVNQFPIRLLTSAATEQAIQDNRPEKSAPEKNEISGTLVYQGLKDDPLSGQGKLQISAFSFSHDNFGIQQSEPLLAEIQNGRLNFTRVKLESRARQISLTGYVDRQTGWNANIGGEWGLGRFFRSVDAFEQISGRLALDLSIRGPVDAPVLAGPLRLSNGSVSFPLAETIVGAENGTIEGYFENGNFRIDKLQARIGEGRISGAGLVENVLQAERRQALISAEFSHVVIEPATRLVAELSGNLQLSKQPLLQPRLAGEIHIESILYENKVNLPRLLRALTGYLINSSDRAASSSSSASRRPSESATSLDLHIFAENGLIVETNVVSAELRSDLRIQGDTNQPRISGQISTADGTFGLGPNEFQIVNGSATFSERQTRIDPELSILGETSVKAQDGDEHLVRMSIRGKLSKPEVDFSSETGLSRESILALFGLGTNLEALSGLGGRTRSIAELLNPASDASLPERLSGLTGFNSVQVDTVLSPSSGELVPRLVAKRPIIGEVQLNVQSELAKSQTSTVSVEYPLTPYLSLISGWRASGLTSNESRDSGNLSLGLTYRITFPGIKLVSPTLTQEYEVPVAR